MSAKRERVKEVKVAMLDSLLVILEDLGGSEYDPADMEVAREELTCSLEHLRDRNT